MMLTHTPGRAHETFDAVAHTFRGRTALYITHTTQTGHDSPVTHDMARDIADLIGTDPTDHLWPAVLHAVGVALVARPEQFSSDLGSLVSRHTDELMVFKVPVHIPSPELRADIERFACRYDLPTGYVLIGTLVRYLRQISTHLN